MNKYLSLYAFFCVCLLDLIGIYFNIPTLVYVVKPLLMITLAWYYFVNAPNLNKYFEDLVIFYSDNDVDFILSSSFRLIFDTALDV